MADSEASTNLYVKGLPLGCTDEDLHTIFGMYGSIRKSRLMHPSGANSDMTALVQLGSSDEAQAAIANLNGSYLNVHGEAVTVRYHGSANAAPSDNLYVKGLPAAITQEEVRMFFETCGSVVKLRVMPPRPPAGDATALVQMGSLEEAEAAIANLNGAPAPGTPQVQMTVRLASGGPKSGTDRSSGFPAAMGTGPPAPAPSPRLVPPSRVPAPAPPSTFTEQQGQALQLRFHGPVNAPPSDNIYVKGLPQFAKEADVREIFQQYGTVISIRIMSSANHVDSTALVKMGSVDEATMAIRSLNGAILNGSPRQASWGASAQRAPAHNSWTSPVVVAPPAPKQYSSRGFASQHSMQQQHFAGAQSKGLRVIFHGTEDAPPSDNLYVKGLPPFITEEEVRHMFASYGDVVSVRVDATAIVRMGSVNQATFALNSLNGYDVLEPQQSTAVNGAQATFDGSVLAPGRTLEVRYHGTKDAPPSDNLYVKGLATSIEHAQLQELFASCGNVLSVKVMPPRGAASDSTALVRMGSVDEASYAISSLHGLAAAASTTGFSAGGRYSPY